ncbi:MAG: type II toxin-antitoxin system RelE family toxin [Dehalococcoidia bacterium]
MPARVLLTPEARQDLRELPAAMLPRVQDVFGRLTKWPDVSGVKWLTREWKGHARIRMGAWRVIFRIEGADVVIARIRPRKEVYE